MAAASDKARFFLEQSVPELKEFERKKIFNAEEISKIARQRSDFEHKINARGSTATDYLRYAQFEINLDALRKKRTKRLGIKGTTYSGQRRIFFVFDRGTKKHPADVGLWLQAIDYAKKQKANKKLQQLFTNVLRLHPTRPELWVYAAQFAMEENGNMTEARGYMQRGLRFNKSKKTLWLQYLRLEMSYIAKIQARREILGIARNVQVAGNDRDDSAEETAKLTAGDILSNKETDEADMNALQTLEDTPVQTGAIPIAVFDAAMEQFKSDSALIAQMLVTLEEYSELVVLRRILQHIQGHIDTVSKDSWMRCACDIWLPVAGVAPTSEAFPAGFRLALKKLRSTQQDTRSSSDLSSWAKRWLDRIMEVEDLDPALLKVAGSVSQGL